MRAKKVKIPTSAGPVLVLSYGQRKGVEAFATLGYGSPLGLCVAQTEDGDCGGVVINYFSDVIGIWTHGNGRGLGRFQPVNEKFIKLVSSANPAFGHVAPSIGVMLTQGISRYQQDFPFVEVRKPVQEGLRNLNLVPVGAIPKFTSYTNRRGVDPNFSMFLEELGISKPENWALAEPNEDASYASLYKYAKQTNDLPIEIANLAPTIWQEMFVFHSEMHDSKTLDYEEARGLLDMTTSPGFPYNTVASTKGEVFAKMPHLDEYLQKDWDSLKDPNWTVFITHSSKEEVRPKEKLDLNKIRGIESMPMDMTIHCVRMFNDMNEGLVESAGKKFSMVGFSPFEGGWDKVIRRIERFRNGFSMDEEQWDSSIRAWLLWGVCEFRFNCLTKKERTPENYQRITHIYRNAINSLVLGPRGNLYLKNLGMPSGFQNTISDNTLILEFLFRLSWKMNVPCDQFAMKDHLAMALMGDDNLWSVSDALLPHFNAGVVKKTMALVGVTANPQSLEPALARNLSFLSSDSINYRGIFLPHLDSCKLFTSLAFSTKSELRKGPYISLYRAIGILIVGWPDINLRKLIRCYISYLKANFGEALADDPNWYCVANAIPSDEKLETLYFGEVAHHQGSSPLKSMEESRVSRGENLLNRLAKAEKLTQSGHDFLIAALDPMHDRQLKDLQGWPDLETAASVVRCVKQTVTFSAPGGVGTGNWDVMISSWPFIENQTFSLNTRVIGNSVIDAANQPQTASLGGVTAHAVATGGSINLFSTLAARIALPAVYSEGTSRIVGMGIEVINTTSALNLQGQVTVFRVPQSKPCGSVMTIMPSANVAATSFASQFIRRPPTTQPESMLLPGSRQWKAADGCYLVVPFVGEDNPPIVAQYTQPIVFASAVVEENVNPAINNTSVWVPPRFPTTLGGPSYFFAQKIHPLHTAGAYFTGLSPQTTLSLTVNTYVESFPNTAEPDILVLATPSACYDPIALEIFSSSLSRMPVGVPADMNGFGDWFMEAIEEAAKTVPIIGPALGAVAKVTKNYLTQPSPQTKPMPIQLSKAKLIRAPPPKQPAKKARKKQAK
jgi:hypothetical protein